MIGSRVHVNSPGPTGMGTEITSNGCTVHGVRRAVITLDYKKANIAELEIVCAGFSGEAEAKFYVKDPQSGDLKEVRRVEFADGSVFG